MLFFNEIWIFCLYSSISSKIFAWFQQIKFENSNTFSDDLLLYITLSDQKYFYYYSIFDWSHISLIDKNFMEKYSFLFSQRRKTIHLILVKKLDKTKISNVFITLFSTCAATDVIGKWSNLCISLQIGKNGDESPCNVSSSE